MGTEDRGDKILKIISNDGGVIRIAEAFDRKRLGNGVEINVHSGYNLAQYHGKKVIGIKFDQVYPKGVKIQSA